MYAFNKMCQCHLIKAAVEKTRFSPPAVLYAQMEQSIGKESQVQKVTRSLSLEKLDNAITRPTMVSICAAHRAWGIEFQHAADSRQLAVGFWYKVQGTWYREE